MKNTPSFFTSFPVSASSVEALDTHLEMTPSYIDYLEDREDFFSHLCFEKDLAGEDFSFEKAMLEWMREHRKRLNLVIPREVEF
jgi:hypothetical protein